MSWDYQPLAKLVQPLSIEAFLTQIAQRQPWYFEGTPERFCELFGWQSLNQILNLYPENTSIRLFQGQMNYYHKKQTEQLGKLLEQLREGATLILEYVDRSDARLAAFADALSDQLGVQTGINLYASAPGQLGFPAHYDTHDFFILQIAGYKRWSIYPETLQSPMTSSAEQTPPPESTKLSERLLSPGDVLYVPRGFWHQALAEREHSVHLTVGLYFNTGIDFFNWLISELKQKVSFRRSLPLLDKHSLPQHSEQPSPFRGHLEALQAELAEFLADPQLLRRFHQDNYACLPRRTAFALPFQYFATAQQLLALEHFEVRSVPYYLCQIDALTLELVYPKSKLNFRPAARPVLDFVLQSQGFSRQDLSQRFGELSWQEMVHVLLPLVQDGIVVPQDQQEQL